MNPSRSTDRVVEVFSDVAIRHCAYREYKSEAAALKALKRRCPGLEPEIYAPRFSAYCRLLEATIQALQDFRNSPSFKPKGPFSCAEDIDKAAILAQLAQQFPEELHMPLDACYGWVLLWHYLK